MAPGSQTRTSEVSSRKKSLRQRVIANPTAAVVRSSDCSRRLGSLCTVKLHQHHQHDRLCGRRKAACHIPYLAQPYSDAEGLERVRYPVVLRMVGHRLLLSSSSTPLMSVLFLPGCEGSQSSPKTPHGRTDYPVNSTTWATAILAPPVGQTRYHVAFLRYRS